MISELGEDGFSTSFNLSLFFICFVLQENSISLYIKKKVKKINKDHLVELEVLVAGVKTNSCIYTGKVLTLQNKKKSMR